MLRLVAIACALTHATVALADPPGVTPPVAAPPAATTEEPYSWQTLAIDAVGAGLFAGMIAAGTTGQGSTETEAAALELASVSVLVLGAPVMHALHGHWQRAVGDMAMRMVPFAVGIEMAISGPGGDEDCGNCSPSAATRALVTTGVLMIAASAIDAAVLARRGKRAPVVPTMAAANGTTTFGLAGRF